LVNLPNRSPYTVDEKKRKKKKMLALLAVKSRKASSLYPYFSRRRSRREAVPYKLIFILSPVDYITVERNKVHT
jgi:hypothetical protein